MNPFPRHDGSLHVEGVPVARIAGEVGTPCYVYSASALVAAYDALDAAFGSVPHLLCYSVKGNMNLAVIRTLVARGGGARGWARPPPRSTRPSMRASACSTSSRGVSFA
jgi:diaminopimelate decarboxylase